MTISVDQGPIGGQDLLRNVVPHLLKLKPTSKRLVGGSPPKASAPLKVFTLGLNDAQGSDPLAAARFVGWRYLIDDNGVAAVADIRPSGDGTHRFSNLSRGAFAVGLQRAAEEASTLYGQAGETYEARVLEIPAVHSVSLWLHGKDDLFFQYLEPNGQVPVTIAENPHYLTQIGTVARDKAARYQMTAHPP